MGKTSILALALAALAITSTQGLDCNDGKIRGVNLGGWLLLEPWITPSIFEEVNHNGEELIVDEYTYAQFVHPNYAETRLNKHWDEFVTREDFVKLSAAGISHIRIPVPYWMWDVTADEPFPPPPASDDEGMRFYLKRAAKWCDELGLKILLDLHGAPGSQNGFDNSGRRGANIWFNPPNHENIDRTIKVDVMMAEMMVGWVNEGHIKSETFYGVEILNEPKGWEQPLWEECRDTFYPDAYAAVREVLPNEYTIVLQQAFRGIQDFYGYMDPKDGYDNVAVDMHEYHAFGEDWNHVAALDNTWDINVNASCDYAAPLSKATLPTFVGEWSLANSDCQKYLDGGYAAPYQPPNGDAMTCFFYDAPIEAHDKNYKSGLSRFMNAQMDSYEAGAGYFFWTFKTENNCAPQWDFLHLLDQGIAPANLCERERECAKV